MGWDRLFLWAYEAARTEVDLTLATSSLLALSELDRDAIDVARVHMLGHVLDRADDPAGHRALRCLAAALRRGDEDRLWRPSHHVVDPWAVAQHRLLMT